MKIVLTGNFNANQSLDEAIAMVFHQYMNKLEDEQPDAAELLNNDCEEVLFTEVSATFGFKMKGKDEPMVISVDPHGEGIEELLVVTAPVDELGDVIISEVSDNDKQSIYTDEQALIAAGMPETFEEIQTAFKSLKPVKTIEVSKDWTVKVMQQAGWGFCDEAHAIVQYYKEGKLVQEVKVDLDETHTLNDVVNQYTVK